MDSSQYAELFLTESREHLSAINHWLLELEQVGTAVGGASGAGEENARAAEAVGAVFRSIHTIKGMSATMGYAVVAELAHELETVLDRMRRNEIVVSLELMDVLFRAADLLEQAIEAAVRGREDRAAAADVLEELRVYASETAPRASGPVVSPAIDPVASMPADTRATAPNEPLPWTVDAPTTSGILVRIRLVKETPLRGVRAFLVVQAIRRLGDVTSVMPPLDVIQRDEFDHDFALRLVTKTSLDEIERVARGAGDVADVQVGEDRPVARTSAPNVSVPSMTTGELPVASRLLAAVEEAPIAATPESAQTTRTTATDPGAGTGQRQQRHVRIDLRRLDSLMNLIGELVITRGRLQQIAGSADDTALQETVTQASRLIGDLRDEIMTSRMVPVWQVFDRFPRLVRDASRALRKQVEFGIEGKDIELDRSMLDEIGDPIVHLLRNAVDHGIETPDDRLRAGKPAAGRLVLSATRDRSAVVIRVTDDGRGIDRDKVLARAKTWGLVEVAKTDLSDDELLRLVSRPGFSTAEQVTQTSGRGVGVDAVYTRVRSLGGAVDIKSIPGQGTTVTLRLPLTLAIVRALLARVGEEVYAVPLTHVSETVELHPEVRRTLRGKEVLVLREDVLPLLRLRSLVGLPDDEASRPTGRGQLEQVVVVEVADRRAGLVVDELAGQQEIVVKQYDAVRDGLKIFGGATILSDGSPALIVDVSSVC